MQQTKPNPKIASTVSYYFGKSVNKILFFNFYEQIWQFIFIVFACLASVIIKKIIDFHTHPDTRDFVYGSIGDLKTVIFTALLTGVIRDYLRLRFVNYVRTIICPIRYPSEEERTERAVTIIKWGIDFIYYGNTSLAAILLFKNTNWMPWQMLGNGDVVQTMATYPRVPDIYGLREFYLIQLGVHLYTFLYQIILKRNDKKFNEYLLHHGMALMLIAFSFSMNFLLVGVLVLFTHDASDTFLVLARSYSDMKNRNKLLLNLLMPITFFVWCWTRLYVFPSCIISTLVNVYGTWDLKIDHIVSLPYIYLVSMLVALLVLHTYWTIFMTKALFNSVIKQKVKIEYDEKERIPKREK